jgi:Trp operon repressor
MPHVSPRKVDKKLIKKITARLVDVLTNEKNTDKRYILKEILTRTEKIMLAKRLAIVLMLSSDIPAHLISETLKVSPTTITKISLKLELGKYENTIKASKEEKIDLEKIFYLLITAGGIMPPKLGKRYWRKY